MALVMARSCEGHNMRRRSPLLSYLATPCIPMMSSQGQAYRSVPTRALKSPRMMSFSDCGKVVV